MRVFADPLSFPLPVNEAERIASLYSYYILDTAEEVDFDELTTLAAAICGTPIAMVCLVDKDRQWFKSHKGVPISETPRKYSFCSHAIAAPDPLMIVEDATKDERFAGNPYVTGNSHIVFYAGVPLVNTDGFALGTLCVIDNEVRQLNEGQVDALKIVAKQVVDKLETRRNLLKLAALNQKLISSDNRFRSLVMQAPVSICVIRSGDLQIQEVNDRYLEMVGKQRKEFEAKTIWEAVPEIARVYAPLMNDVIDTGIPFYANEHELLLVKDGKPELVIVDFVYEPIKLADGIVDAIMMLGVDVTDKVMSRRKVEEMEARVRLAVEAADIGTYDVDMINGTITTSERFDKIFNLTAPAKLDDYISAIHPDDNDKRKEAHLEANTTGKLFYEARIIYEGGAIHWIRVTGQYYLKDGEVTRILGTLLDITELKRLQQQKDDFLSIASHELKTPVTALRAALQLLDRIKEKPFSPMHHKLIEQCSRSMEKMSTLVDDLLNVNRISEGQLQLGRSDFTIAELLNLTCNHVRLAGKHELIVEGDGELIVHADEDRIEQVIINLVNNAVKYAPDSKEIYLKAENLGDRARISVRDNGPGIPHENLPYLFDRYYRADHTSKAYKGLGLGLYICAEIIKKHGGEIGVESKLGEGSVFWFTLPLQ